MFYYEFHIYVWECFTGSHTQKYEVIAKNEEEWVNEMHCIQGCSVCIKL